MARFDFIAVYIMASRPNGTLYIGVTSDLLSRINDHKQDRFDGFAKRYGCKTLVWWETHSEIHEAIAREKQLKAWERKWKLALIEKQNPTWCDLHDDLLLPRHLRQDHLWPDQP
jgi:putative endonuclease